MGRKAAWSILMQKFWIIYFMLAGEEVIYWRSMWKWLNQIKNSLNVGVNTWYHTCTTRGVSQNKMTYWVEYDIIGAYGKIKQDKEYTPLCGMGPPACAEALMNPLISMTLEVDDSLIIYECDGGHDREGGPQGRCLSVWSPVICRSLQSPRRAAANWCTEPRRERCGGRN